MKKVVIICKSISQYRQEFFNQLRNELQANNIELILIYGKLKNSDSLRNDEIAIDWAIYIENKSLRFKKLEIIWQPCTQYLENADLVIVENANKLVINYLLAFSRYFNSYKFAYWGHGQNLQEKSNSLNNKFKNIFITACDWWFAYTSKVKAQIVEKKFPSNKITVVQNAIDTKNLIQIYDNINKTVTTQLRNELNINNCNVGLYCGAMSVEKNIDLVLEACYLVKKQIPDFHIIFIGSGIDEKKVIKASQNENWIHYIGSKFNEEKVKYFKVSDIQIMPYAVGLSILDSFATETPLVTMKDSLHGPEIEYLEDGINGFISNNNINEFAEKIIDILRYKLYKTILPNCRLNAEKYSIENMVSNFKNGIISCLNS